mmetsp:Transcript_4187/g.10307  ORF Transcript_4187/g.10307 Transcript_4187/m.10307 type:complete len:212 (-) Transcript_4187:41-676(-)
MSWPGRERVSGAAAEPRRRPGDRRRRDHRRPRARTRPRRSATAAEDSTPDPPALRPALQRTGCALSEVTQTEGPKRRAQSADDDRATAPVPRADRDDDWDHRPGEVRRSVRGWLGLQWRWVCHRRNCPWPGMYFHCFRMTPQERDEARQKRSLRFGRAEPAHCRPDRGERRTRCVCAAPRRRHGHRDVRLGAGSVPDILPGRAFGTLPWRY